YRGNLIRGMMIRFMYMKGFLVHVKNLRDIDILCTMTKNIVIFVKRISGFSLLPVEGAMVNPESPYFIQEQKKYPKYFIPELMKAYYFNFDIDKADMVLPKDMVLLCEQKEKRTSKSGKKQLPMTVYGG
ncbi:hypothetical protein LJC44_00410, partial [Parabacteroides sp. OttesenSCG-928-G06]|nr:hypothetical protein [Parabacteroides sp. OttesenSCG-928-G06]